MSKKAAKRPAPRTVSVEITEGDFAGWKATAKADFPASVLADFQTDDVHGLISVMDRLIVEHNMPNSNDEVAEHLADVDPYQGAIEIIRLIAEEIGKLPNR